MYELALFSGAGGGILGGKLCGFTCIGAVEIEDYPRQVLLQRQRDGILPRFPIWDDVRTFREDNEETREYIDKLKSIRHKLVITGGFPCQDISSAGKGAGIKAGNRSGLWFEMARIINEIRPKFVLVENSPALTSRGLGIVLGDLAKMDYNAKTGVLGAVDVGAPHKRERIWILANSNSQSVWKQSELKQKFKSSSKLKYSGIEKSMANPMQLRSQGVRTDRTIEGQIGLCSREGSNKEQTLPNTMSERCSQVEQVYCRGKTGPRQTNQAKQCPINSRQSGWWEVEPELGRVADGVADRVDRLEAIGNGQVPAVAYAAWELFK